MILFILFFPFPYSITSTRHQIDISKFQLSVSDTSLLVIYCEFLIESQDVVWCFAKSPSCKGQSVNRFRFWILQEAMLEAKLKICPEVNYKSLKDRIENTGK